MKPRNIAVIGSGIVGMSTALWLQKDGHQVSVIDPRQPGTATSYGNAGAIVTGSVEPTSTPGALKHIPRYLLDPASAVRIRWGYLPKLAPWLIRFLLESRPSAVARASAGLAALMQGAYAAHRDLVNLTGTHDIIRPAGWLKVYTSEKAFRGTALQRRLMDEHGIKYDVLNADEIHQLEPGLARKFSHGLFHADSAFASLPKKLIDGYTAHFLGHGGQWLPESVRRLEPLPDGRLRVHSELGLREFDSVVICTGAWSKSLAAQLGDKVLLDTERGYHLNIAPGTAGDLRRPVLFSEWNFVMAPMQDGIRMTSGEELAGLDAEPDFRRIRKLLPIAQEMLPGLSDRVTREWMGRRPSTPDSLPVIGRSPKAANVFYNFGHQHLGLTLGPVSGKLMADLIAGRETAVDLTAYRINRF